MKETGIIMSGNHPKLILDGVKTQTRRVIKPQPETVDFTGYHLLWKGKRIVNSSALIPLCPYGQVGDRLWVRETWKEYNSMGGIVYKADGDLSTGFPWKPSIHMFRKDSRITRDITLLRVELLRDISEADAKAEGGYKIEEFIKLFLKLNHLPEDADPWNWVIGW